eukprot:tig00021721_g23205.t1
MDDDSAIVRWVGTFDGLSRPCVQLQDLSDGQLFSEMLFQISPQHFPAPQGPLSDPRKQLHLVTELAHALQAYYRDVLGVPVNLENIDLPQAVKGDAAEILKLAELTLGCAVQCENKAQYVTAMMSQDSETQAQLMIMIEGIINGTSAVLAPSSPSKPRASEAVGEGAGRSAADIAELERLRVENTRLLNELEAIRADHQSTMEEHKQALAKVAEERAEWNKLLANQKAEIDRIKKSCAMAESQSQEYRTEAAEKDRQIADLKQKAGELGRAEKERRALQDELDVTKAKLAQAGRDEAALEKYKKLAQGAADLKKQLKTTEEQLNGYIEKNLDQEEQLKKIGALKGQVESYKQQVVAAEERAAELQVALQKKEFEAGRLQEALKAATGERAAAQGELEGLRARLASLQAAPAAGEGGGLEEGLLGGMSVETREKMARLEREVAALRGAGPEAEKLALLESQLDDALRLKGKFEQEHLRASGRLLQLEADVADLQQKLARAEAELASRPSEAAAASRALEAEKGRVAELERALEEARGELQRASSAAHGASKEAAERLQAEGEKLAASVEKLTEEVEREREEKERAREEARRHMEEVARALRDKDEVREQYMKLREQIHVQDRTVAEQESALSYKTAELRRLGEENVSLTAIAKAGQEQLAGLQEQLAKAEKRVYEAQLGREQAESRAREGTRALEEKLVKSGHEIANLMADKSRLEAYMKQAKQVIAKQQEDWKARQKEARGRELERYEGQVEGLREQLREKEAALEQLKRTREEERAAIKRENKLVMTAFYEMGFDLMKMRAMPQMFRQVATSPLGRLRQHVTGS